VLGMGRIAQKFRDMEPRKVTRYIFNWLFEIVVPIGIVVGYSWNELSSIQILVITMMYVLNTFELLKK
jgi:hypothetical protein